MVKERQPISFIATSEPELAQAFYGDVLGLNLVEASPYALVFQDAGQMLRVQIVPDFTAPAYTAHGWQVVDIEKEILDLSAKGVVLLRFGQMEQSASGVWTTPDGHKIAWFSDPCGNVLSLTEFS